MNETTLIELGPRAVWCLFMENSLRRWARLDVVRARIVRMRIDEMMRRVRSNGKAA